MSHNPGCLAGAFGILRMLAPGFGQAGAPVTTLALETEDAVA